MPYNINAPETYTSESEIVNAHWASDNTKTIEDVIKIMTDIGVNRNTAISTWKTYCPNVNDWSV